MHDIVTLVCLLVARSILVSMDMVERIQVYVDPIVCEWDMLVIDVAHDASGNS